MSFETHYISIQLLFPVTSLATLLVVSCIEKKNVGYICYLVRVYPCELDIICGTLQLNHPLGAFTSTQDSSDVNRLYPELSSVLLVNLPRGWFSWLVTWQPYTYKCINNIGVET